jgi:hypothetical protein
MKASRIVPIAATVILAVYVLVLQIRNAGVLVRVPFAGPMPLFVPLVTLMLLTALVAWLPPTLHAWRQGREKRALERRVAELEVHLPSYDRSDGEPVIPDREGRPGPSNTDGA